MDSESLAGELDSLNRLGKPRNSVQQPATGNHLAASSTSYETSTACFGYSLQRALRFIISIQFINYSSTDHLQPYPPRTSLTRHSIANRGTLLPTTHPSSSPQSHP